MAVVGAVYSTTTMAAAGASFEQIVAANAVGLFAGTVGGALGGMAVRPFTGNPAVSILAGAISGGVSTVLSSVVAGQKLGWNVLQGAAMGAASGAVVWALTPAAPVAQADQAVAEGASAANSHPPGTLVAGDAMGVVPKSEPSTDDTRSLFEKAVGKAEYKIAEHIAEEHIDYSTEPGGAEFFSGRANRIDAEDDARTNGRETLNMRLEANGVSGRFPERMMSNPTVSSMSDEQRGALVDLASGRFAKAASGVPTAYVNGAAPESTWIRIELQALSKNPKAPYIDHKP